jgi:hypothetical protein
LGDAQQLGRFDLGQAALFDEPVQLRDDARFQQPLFGVGQAEVSENIAAAFVGFDFFRHGLRSPFSVRAR